MFRALVCFQPTDFYIQHVYDFYIALLHNMLTQCAFNVTVLTCKIEMYSHWGLRILSRQSVTVFEMAPFNVMYELCKLPLPCKPKVRLVLPCYEEYYEEQTPRGMCVWCSSVLFVVSLEEYEIGWGLYTLLQQGG